MKKSIVMMMFALATLSIVSCKEEAKEAATTDVTTEVIDEHAGHNHAEGEMHMASYACPMDCEKGKVYDKPGKCPVCEMDLTEVKDEASELEGHEGHNH